LRTHRVQVGILRAGTEQGKTYASFTMLVLLGHEGAADEVGCGPLWVRAPAPARQALDL